MFCKLSFCKPDELSKCFGKVVGFITYDFLSSSVKRRLLFHRCCSSGVSCVVYVRYEFVRVWILVLYMWSSLSTYPNAFKYSFISIKFSFFASLISSAHEYFPLTIFILVFFSLFSDVQNVFQIVSQFCEKLNTTKLKTDWRKTTFFKWRVSIILWSFSS